MEITWYGANCVALREEGITVLYDPFQTDVDQQGQALLLDSTGVSPALREPGFHVDILVSSLQHSQDAFQAIPGNPVVVSVPGQFESGGVFIHSLPCDLARPETDSQAHAETAAADAGRLVHFFDFGQTGVMHMGHPGAEFRLSYKRLVEDLVALKTDILILPMGTGTKKDMDWALRLCKALEPRICIPVQYDPAALGEIAHGLQAMGSLNEEPQKRYRATRKDAGSEGSSVVMLTVSPISKP